MKIHIIRPDDRMWDLAQKYNIPLERLLEANPQIKDPDKLEAGGKVRIPTGRIPLLSPKQTEWNSTIPEPFTPEPEPFQNLKQAEPILQSDSDQVQEFDEQNEYVSPYFPVFPDMICDINEYDESMQSFESIESTYTNEIESSALFESALQDASEWDDLPVPPMLSYPPSPYGHVMYVPPLFDPAAMMVPPPYMPNQEQVGYMPYLPFPPTQMGRPPVPEMQPLNMSTSEEAGYQADPNYIPYPSFPPAQLDGQPAPELQPWAQQPSIIAESEWREKESSSREG